MRHHPAHPRFAPLDSQQAAELANYAAAGSSHLVRAPIPDLPMKTYLLALCLLASAPAFAQTAPPVGQEAAQPFKKANVVIINTTDSASVAYKKLAGILLNAGYTLDRADKDLGFLNTKERSAPKLNVRHSLRAAIMPAPSGSRIELRDSFVAPAISSRESETTLRGMKGSPFMVCWDELVRVAGLYPGGQLSYKEQP